MDWERTIRGRQPPQYFEFGVHFHLAKYSSLLIQCSQGVQAWWTGGPGPRQLGGPGASLIRIREEGKHGGPGTWQTEVHELAAIQYCTV
jgi:hypothetical protein